MTRKRTATLLQTTEEFLSVLEFFAVGNEPTAVLFRAVKGGDNLPKHLISAIIKVHLSFFYLLSFFIGHLTLSYISFEFHITICAFHLMTNIVMAALLSFSYLL